MSSLVPKNKVDGIKAQGAEVRIIGRSQDDAQEDRASRHGAQEDGAPYTGASKDGAKEAGPARSALGGGTGPEPAGATPPALPALARIRSFPRSHLVAAVCASDAQGLLHPATKCRLESRP